MINFRIGVKAFIVEDGKLLMIRRRKDDPHNANQWDLPGGRVDLGEDPRTGLVRETKAETNLDIKLLLPLDVQHFTRQDGQIITLLFFLCEKKSDSILLSHEHQEYKWEDLSNFEIEVPDWLEPVLINYKTCCL
ncbi:MAG: NUDIX domain-containing protein [Candidatus Doudnabacteria bacterium]|nr:NUDIX domain-containing protein [Candidatus Doudnabacteria bacterium]